MFRQSTLYRISDLCFPRNETEWPRAKFLCICERLYIPRIGWPRSQFLHSCICERFIYSQDWSAHLVAAKWADQSWEYINRSEIHECGNCETEHYNSVLEITRLCSRLQRFRLFLRKLKVRTHRWMKNLILRHICKIHFSFFCAVSCAFG